MRKFFWIGLLAAFVACGKNRGGIKGTAEDPQPGHPDLVCPPGTEPAGYAPPLAVEVWCRRFTLQGAWVRHGPSIEWWQLYARKATGQYFDGVKHAQWTYWYLGGELDRVETWNMGKLEGAFIEYFDNGQKKSEGMMVDGHPEGPWVYWRVDGTKEREGAYLDGALNGPWIIYAPNGTPQTQRTYRNGRLRFQEELSAPAPLIE